MKRLITCSDGTWDKPGAVDQNGKPLDSNVCLLYKAIAKADNFGTEQLKVYDTGVGTGYSLKDKMEGGIIGMGLDKKIKDIYTFLLLNYLPGDHIYLFGFSRGAYTARSLGGFIRNCGILKPEYIHLVDKAYELYRDKNDYTKPDDDLMKSFRKNYCFEDITRVKFIGVWDTVGSLGIPLPAWKFYNQERYSFHDVTLSSTIDYAYQALAVDERRKPFVPALWEASDNTAHGKNKDMEQRWFAGVHCNVGGGYADTGLSDHALRWLIDKAIDTGLTFDVTELKGLRPDFNGAMGNSFTPAFWLAGKVWRVIGESKYPNQKIDDSVKERIIANPNYRPDNLKEFFKDIWR